MDVAVGLRKKPDVFGRVHYYVSALSAKKLLSLVLFNLLAVALLQLLKTPKNIHEKLSNMIKNNRSCLIDVCIVYMYHGITTFQMYHLHISYLHHIFSSRIPVDPSTLDMIGTLSSFQLGSANWQDVHIQRRRCTSL